MPATPRLTGDMFFPHIYCDSPFSLLPPMRYHPFCLHLLLLHLFFALSSAALAQTETEKMLLQDVNGYISRYANPGYKPYNRMKADSVRLDEVGQEVCIYVNESFASQIFTPALVKRIYKEIAQCLTPPYHKWKVAVLQKEGRRIDDLIPNLLRKEGDVDHSRLWQQAHAAETPWITPLSRPFKLSKGLEGRHLFICPSHGRYYKGPQWKWQRPNLFCTTEDLLTQSFVFPFLIPMLEKAGAVVGCPRERDYQTFSIVVDNDLDAGPALTAAGAPSLSRLATGSYAEEAFHDAHWTTSDDSTGFRQPLEGMNDSVFPFRSGTYRYIEAVQRRHNVPSATWTPCIPATGRYAVYVSYKSLPRSVSDAKYIVHHLGGASVFSVNQQMGGGTWVYLGTFPFAEGRSSAGKVVLEAGSEDKGIVTADAVRFGGGMSIHSRGEAGTSGLPRYLEAARYAAAYAGVPDSLVNTTASANDYNDDIRTRGNMVNWLAGGSTYLPDHEGARVPFELSLALHTDAGWRTDGSIYGSLAISTGRDGEGATSYTSGLSRRASNDLAALLIHDLSRDLSATCHLPWTLRENWDRNYGETRIPNVPSAILEMLSHQNFSDMRLAHDPSFKFTVARSVYKTLARYIRSQHGLSAPVIQPLPPHAFCVSLSADGSEAILSWEATTDSLEASARPKGYVLYTATAEAAGLQRPDAALSPAAVGFDNGRCVQDNEIRISLTPGRLYAFKVSAYNEGGESFPSETLVAYRAPTADGHPDKRSKRLLMVNAFTRVSGPAYIATPDSLGFLLDEDYGVPYLSTTAFSGRQAGFATYPFEGAVGSETGRSGNELSGKELGGNSFDYPLRHALDMLRDTYMAAFYSFGSTSAEALPKLSRELESYQAINYIAGLQRRVRHNLRSYPVFTSQVCHTLSTYLRQQRGTLLVSGAYVADDARHDNDAKRFTEHMLKIRCASPSAALCARQATDTITGLQMQFALRSTPDAQHYGLQGSNAILPAHGTTAFSCFAYADHQGAGVAYDGTDYRCLTLGFPFESITDGAIRTRALRAILHFLLKE